MKLSNTQLGKIKSRRKNEAYVTLTFLSNMIGTNEANFMHNIILTDGQVLSLCEAFARFSHIIHQRIQNYQNFNYPA